MLKWLTNKWFFIILIIGIFARIYQLGVIPGDINQDEAYAAYEAYSMLNYGTDSWGYKFPVYLVTWGSGMNALNTYLMIPFIAIFGLHTWVIRLPQFIVAIFTIIVVFLLMDKIANKKIAYICMGLLAISPWHIFLSRWGLESNLAPGFLIFGLYFFIKGIDNQKYFIISAIMYGLSLYCYATVWPFVPIILILQILYCMKYHKIKFQKETIIAAAILVSLSLPLLLFLAVNMGYIDEITLPFISIPKLVYMRSNEISLNNIVENLKNLWQIIVKQTDGSINNSTDNYGTIYYCTLPFFFFGLYYGMKKILLSIVNKAYQPMVFIAVQLITPLLCGMVIHVNINRINTLFIPMILWGGGRDILDLRKA